MAGYSLVYRSFRHSDCELPIILVLFSLCMFIDLYITSARLEIRVIKDLSVCVPCRHVGGQTYISTYS